MLETAIKDAQQAKELFDQLERMTKAFDAYRRFREVQGTSHGTTIDKYNTMVRCNDSSKLLLRSIRSGR